MSLFAQMAELVDALVSGTSVRKYVQVRVLFWALKIPQSQRLMILGFCNLIDNKPRWRGRP